MTTILRHAHHTGELDDVLRLRHEVLLESGRVPSNSFKLSGKIIDPFDVYPTTRHFIAYQNSQAVGTVRAVAYSASDAYFNQIFDYRESFNNLKSDCFFLDMLAVKKSMAGHPVFLRELIKLPLQTLAWKSSGNVFFNAPVSLVSTISKFGCNTLSEPIKSPHLEIEVQPCIISLKDIQNQTGTGVVDEEIIRFQEVAYSVIFDPGEIIVVEGEKGTTAYLIEEGEVDVIIQKGDSLVPISTITHGRLIGEVAMITNEPRTASLIAKKVTTCTAFDRSAFMQLMLDEPHRSLDLFKIFSRRLGESNQRIVELSKKVN